MCFIIKLTNNNNNNNNNNKVYILIMYIIIYNSFTNIDILIYN
jgi:hypothetical protein